MKRRSIGEPEPLGRRFRPGRRLRIVDLREMDDAAVAAEIVVAQLGEAVEAEPLDDERVEMAGEKISQVEGAQFLLGERREDLLPGVEGVAMRACDAFHPFLGEDAVEFAAGAAVAVEAQDFVVGGAIGADLRPHRLGDPLGVIVEARGQAGQIDPVEPESQNFARKRAAADDEHLAGALLAARIARLGVDVGDGRMLAAVIPANAGIQITSRRRLPQ